MSKTTIIYLRRKFFFILFYFNNLLYFESDKITNTVIFLTPNTHYFKKYRRFLNIFLNYYQIVFLDTFLSI